MIDQDLAIEPPPSLEAILSHRERIGRVDFTHRLVADPPPPRADDEDGHAAEHPAGPGTGHIATEPAVEAAGDPAPEPATAETTAPETPGLQPSDRQLSDRQTSDRQASVAQTPDHDETDEPAGSDPQPDPQLDPDDFLVAPPAASPATLAGAEASAQVAALLSLVPAEDMDTVTEDVSEVVEGVLARIREVRSATLAHLEAIEVEAALRCEMLTAQAELDAELIRLHARREAHAIVAAARARSGMPPVPADDVRRLDHLAGAASRLVESLEELGPRPGSPDHLYLP